MTDANDPVPLTPAVFHTLLALSDGEQHGYGIMLEVAALTDGAMRLGPGTLKRLLAAGLVEESGEERPDTALDDERRRYYRLTEQGQRTAEARRLERLVSAARDKRLLRPKPSEGPA